MSETVFSIILIINILVTSFFSVVVVVLSSFFLSYYKRLKKTENICYSNVTEIELIKQKIFKL